MQNTLREIAAWLISFILDQLIIPRIIINNGTLFFTQSRCDSNNPFGEV